jgi:hypothetical protein
MPYVTSIERLAIEKGRQETLASQREADAGAHVQELSLRSLKRLINQLKEEFARHEAASIPR